MAKIVEVQIVNPCPLAGSHPGMLERIPVFPLMEKSTTDSWSFSQQKSRESNTFQCVDMYGREPYT